MSDQGARVTEDLLEVASQCGGLRISVLGYCSQWGDEIATAVRGNYRLSQTVRGLAGGLPARAIVVQFVPGACHARGGRVEFDPTVPIGVADRAGVAAMGDEQCAALFHELTRALVQVAAGADAPGSAADGQAAADCVLRELDLSPPFASVVPEALALGQLTYEGRWRGTPSWTGSVRSMAGSNVVYLPFPSVPPVRVEGERGLHPCRLPGSWTVLLAACGIEKELASDLLSAPPLDLQALKAGGRGWPSSVG